jgi:hypothetical protein
VWPESYIADGTVFTFATRNESLFAGVLGAFSEALGGPTAPQRSE